MLLNQLKDEIMKDNPVWRSIKRFFVMTRIVSTVMMKKLYKLGF